MLILLAAISHFLYFATHQPLKFAIVFLVIAALFGWAFQKRTGSVAGYFMIIVAFVGSMTNLFLTHWANAAFLSSVGTYGSAVIIDRRDANFMLNDTPVSHYDTLIRTAEGGEVLTSFSELSAAISPIRNDILIPPINERFVIKYVPGAEKNIVIMSDESEYGKRLLLIKARQPIDRARRLHEASPDNAQFRQGYRDALERFLKEQRDTAPQDDLDQYQRALDALE